LSFSSSLQNRRDIMPYQETTTRNRPSLRIEPLAKPVDRKADDATGVNVDDRKPIHPSMPHMPPA
jgi:hypothetical protein